MPSLMSLVLRSYRLTFIAAIGLLCISALLFIGAVTSPKDTENFIIGGIIVALLSTRFFYRLYRFRIGKAIDWF